MSDFADMVAQCSVVASVMPASEFERARTGLQDTVAVTLNSEFADLRLLVAVPRRPHALPVVVLPEPNGRAHVMRDGNLCYFAASSQVRIDWNRPVEVYDWAIRKAAEVALAPESLDELIDELVFYWSESGADARRVRCWRLPPSGNQWIHVYQSEIVFDVGRDQAEAPNALVLDILDAERFVRKMVAPGRLASVDLNSALPEALNRSGRKLLEEFWKRSAELVLLRVHTSTGPHVLLGLTNLGGTLVPAVVQRLDDAFLRPRGGAGDFDRAVIVIGCGAVGGHIPEELARVGFRNLTLVDPDVLLPENAYRHRYGSIHRVPIAKVVWAKAEVEVRFGDRVAIAAYQSRAEEVLPELLRLHPDAIIVCVPGDATAYTNVTRIVREHPAAQLVLGWVEPYGVAGHVMETAPGRVKGCYDCLFSASEISGCVTDVLAPGQRLTRRMAGCGQVFTRFSSIDALEVATEVVRAVTRLAVSPIEQAKLTSWRRHALNAPPDLQFADWAMRLEDGQRLVRMARDFAPEAPCSTCEAWS